MDEEKKPAQSMKWRKASESVVKLFGELAAVLPPDVERRKMFGLPCVFVNGQLFAGVHQDNIMMRLSEADRATFLALDGAARFEPMPGRPMREYVVIPQAMLAAPDQILPWLDKSCAYARTIPPKPPKPPRKK